MPSSTSTSTLNRDEVAISVRNVSKAYRIWRDPSARLKAPLVEGWQKLRAMSYELIAKRLNPGFRSQKPEAPSSKLQAPSSVPPCSIPPSSSKYYKDFYALKDVSFEVKKGEAVGIIGRNGSGKSTLLQMIAGTLTPTSGSIQVKGRVAALLELGSGFNPDFTGRENVYLNASVLGLTKEEINGLYDQITAFADIGDFIEQPVKTYSSGMMVRLAFAVQCAVQPDVLIIDEALSVGDVGFRNKCLERIQQLRDRGVTTLFVSHDLGTLQVLCNRVVYLDRGCIVQIGEPCDVCQNFYAHMMGLNSVECTAEKHSLIPQQNTGRAVFSRFDIDAPKLGTQAQLKTGDTLRFLFRLEAIVSVGQMAFGLSIYRTDGDWVIGQTSRDVEIFWPACEPGQSINGRITLPQLALAPGDYVGALAAYDKELKICYALTDLTTPFSVRADFPVWGKFVHQCLWQP